MCCPRAEAARVNGTAMMHRWPEHPSKAEGGEIATAPPPGYNRGQNQEPVTKAYENNWNLIFAKKKSDNSQRALT